MDNGVLIGITPHHKETVMEDKRRDDDDQTDPIVEEIEKELRELYGSREDSPRLRRLWPLIDQALAMDTPRVRKPR